MVKSFRPTKPLEGGDATGSKGEKREALKGDGRAVARRNWKGVFRKKQMGGRKLHESHEGGGKSCRSSNSRYNASNGGPGEKRFSIARSN